MTRRPRCRIEGPKRGQKNRGSIIILPAERRARAKLIIVETTTPASVSSRRRPLHAHARVFIMGAGALDAACLLLPLLLPRSVRVDWVDGQSRTGRRISSRRRWPGVDWSVIDAEGDQEAADRSRGLVGPSSSRPAGTDTDTSISGQGWRPALVYSGSSSGGAPLCVWCGGRW